MIQIPLTHGLFAIVDLGLFDSPEEAARCYDSAARKMHGEFASVNFTEER